MIETMDRYFSSELSSLSLDKNNWVSFHVSLSASRQALPLWGGALVSELPPHSDKKTGGSRSFASLVHRFTTVRIVQLTCNGL